jgi:hypothetical protein
MTYTVWIHGQQIGQTAFEHEHDRRRRAGSFQPTEFGLQVLPAITAMVPALFEFGAMCKRRGLDPDSASEADAETALDVFGGTPEGQRVMAAAQQIAELEVRDPRGRIVPWESLAITDLEWLIAYAREMGDPEPNKAIDDLPAHEPIKFMISLTLKREVGGDPAPWLSRARKIAVPQS